MLWKKFTPGSYIINDKLKIILEIIQNFKKRENITLIKIVENIKIKQTNL